MGCYVSQYFSRKKYEILKINLFNINVQSSDEDVLEDTVLCLSTVAGHVGVVSPNLTLPDAVISDCLR